MNLYKLTDCNGQTYGETQWDEGVSHSGTGKGAMCGGGWIHAYRSPLLAVLFNPIHAAFDQPRLWEAEGRVEKDDGQKVGCRTLTTHREIPMPEITDTQRVRFAILCAQQVYSEPLWMAWANDWLSGQDRSMAPAQEAAVRADAAYWAAEAVARAAFWAAETAAEAAKARAAFWAAEAAKTSARATAVVRAATWAAQAKRDAKDERIDFAKLALAARKER